MWVIIRHVLLWIMVFAVACRGTRYANSDEWKSEPTKGTGNELLTNIDHLLSHECKCPSETIRYKNTSFVHPQYIESHKCKHTHCGNKTMCIEVPYRITVWNSVDKTKKNVSRSRMMCEDLHENDNFSLVQISAACIAIYNERLIVKRLSLT